MKVGDLVKLKKESNWIRFRPELIDVPMVVTEVRVLTGLGTIISLIGPHGVSKFSQSHLEAYNEAG